MDLDISWYCYFSSGVDLNVQEGSPGGFFFVCLFKNFLEFIFLLQNQ